MTLRLTPDDDGIARAAHLLGQGRLIAFPTETVYGLGADATDSAAVAGIYAAKGRPAFNPLISHVQDLAAAQREGVFEPLALRLAERFWPGPLTLVVPLAQGSSVCDLARAGLASIGLRVPSHPVARALLARFGRPIAAPSANRSGHVSPTLASHVLADLEGAIDAVLDGGPAAVGLESTIVAVVDDHAYWLRPGSITRDDIERTIGQPVLDVVSGGDENAPVSPGRLASHYAPATPVRLNATRIAPGEAVLAFGSDLPAGAEHALIVQNLSPTANLTEAATHLYIYLRNLDKLQASAIAVAPIPDKGLGEAINDRLMRAAAPKTLCN